MSGEKRSASPGSRLPPDNSFQYEYVRGVGEGPYACGGVAGPPELGPAHRRRGGPGGDRIKRERDL
jgi:hypothetical protein